jgi:superfamily II DNA/RNA helicase
VATPGRLQDHLKRGTIDLSATEIVVLDEADQMADMGFLPVVTEVLALTPQDGQRLLFSATLDRDVDKLVKKFMKNPVTHEIAVTEQRQVDMDHHVLVVDSHVKDDVIAQIASREGRTIFFVRTKHGADRLTDKLKKQGVDAGVLHGGRTQKQRMKVLDSFKIGKKRALIATDVAARGIHVDDVSLVVHVDPPETHKDYLHRAGRTARAGAKGTVVSLASSGNRKRVHNIGKDAGVKMTETRIESMHPELMRITGAQEPSGIPVSDEPAPRNERSKSARDRAPRRDRDDRRDSKPRFDREERPKFDREERPRREAKPRFERDEKPRYEKRASFEKKDRYEKSDRYEKKSRPEERKVAQRSDAKPDRDSLRRKDRASKPFDKRLEKRIKPTYDDRKPRYDREERFEDRKPKRDRVKRSERSERSERPEKKSTGPNRIARRAHMQPADRPVKTRHEKRSGKAKAKKVTTGTKKRAATSTGRAKNTGKPAKSKPRTKAKPRTRAGR